MSESVADKASRYYLDCAPQPKFRVGPEDECWPWLGTINPVTGYGNLIVSGAGRHVIVAAHRHVYRLLVGRIPPTYQLDHLCRNRRCVNPDHLEVVSNWENAQRRPDLRKYQSHCCRGHELTPENIYTRPNGWINCRTCRRDDQRNLRRRRGIPTRG